MENSKHLTQIETALYSEYLMGCNSGKNVTVDCLTDHLENCTDCRKKVMEICDLVPLLGLFLDDDKYRYVRDSGNIKRDWLKRAVMQIRLLFQVFSKTALNFIQALRLVREVPHHGL